MSVLEVFDQVGILAGSLVNRRTRPTTTPALAVTTTHHHRPPNHPGSDIVYQSLPNPISPMNTRAAHAPKMPSPRACHQHPELRRLGEGRSRRHPDPALMRSVPACRPAHRALGRDVAGPLVSTRAGGEREGGGRLPSDWPGHIRPNGADEEFSSRGSPGSAPWSAPTRTKPRAVVELPGTASSVGRRASLRRCSSNPSRLDGSPRRAAYHKTAIGLIGEPVPPPICRGAATNRKSHRPADTCLTHILEGQVVQEVHSHRVDREHVIGNATP